MPNKASILASLSGRIPIGAASQPLEVSIQSLENLPNKVSILASLSSRIPIGAASQPLEASNNGLLRIYQRKPAF